MRPRVTVNGAAFPAIVSVFYFAIPVIAEPAPAMQSAALPNGITIPFVEQGDPDGLPVVLLHGVTDSWRSFELLLPHVPARMRVFAITQRGHGGASKPETGYRFTDFSEDLRLFLDTQGIDRAVIVGHSMGTGVAQRFAIDHPNRVRGVVLIGAFARWRQNAVVLELWDSALNDLTDPVDPEFVREFQRSTLAQPVPDAFFDGIVRESLNVPARVWRSAFDGFRNTDHSAELARITAPALILWGDREAICPRADQDLLVSALPDARLIVYEGFGHAPHWEAPERVAGDLFAFVDGLPE